MFLRRATPLVNGLSQLLDKEPDSTPVEAVLDHSDLAVSLRNEIPQLLDYIAPDCPPTPQPTHSVGHLRELFEWACQPGEGRDQTNPRFAKLSAAATRCLSHPSQRLLSRLRGNKGFIADLQQFIGNEASMSHPLYAGHFEMIAMALIRQSSSLLNDEFEMLFSRIVEHIDLLCWQEALASWAIDWPSLFGQSFPTPVIAFHFIGDRAVDFALASPPCERLQGLYCALRHIIAYQDAHSSLPFFCDLETLLRLSDSLKIVIFSDAERLSAGEKPELQLVIGAGVRLISLIAKVLQKAQPPDAAVSAARQFLRQAAKATYSHLDKKYESTPALEQLKIDIFPAYWRGGIDKMADLFFRREGGSAEFNRTMIKALYRWHQSPDPVHFEVFIHEHEILEKIAQQPFPIQDEVRRSDKPQVLMNAHVFALARLIYEGKYKDKRVKQSDGSWPAEKLESPAPEPRRAPPAYIKEYDRFGAWIAANLWDQIDYVRQKWTDIEQILK
jgi:hypothetical protein